LPKIVLFTALQTSVRNRFRSCYQSIMPKTLEKLAMRLATAATMLLATVGTGTSESLSNRHHLSCTNQSAPVVIPHATARTVRLGLPADIGPTVNLQDVYGWDEETRLRLRRQGLSVRTEGGGARLVVEQNSACPH